MHIAAYEKAILTGILFYMILSIHMIGSTKFFFQISGVIWDFSIISNFSPVTLDVSLLKINDDNLTIFLVPWS